MASSNSKRKIYILFQIAYLVLTSGELEHSASNDTLLLPSIASRSMRVVINSSSCSRRIVQVNKQKIKTCLNHTFHQIRNTNTQSDLFRICVVNSISFGKCRCYTPVGLLYVNVNGLDVMLPNATGKGNCSKRAITKDLNSINAISRHFTIKEIKSLPIFFKH